MLISYQLCSDEDFYLKVMEMATPIENSIACLLIAVTS